MNPLESKTDLVSIRWNAGENWLYFATHICYSYYNVLSLESMCGKIFHTVGNSVGNFRRMCGKSVWNFLITSLLIAWKNACKTHWYNLVDVIEWNWNILYKRIFSIICRRVYYRNSLAKNFNGFSGCETDLIQFYRQPE